MSSRVDGCPTCPDGHPDRSHRPWSVWLAPNRDRDDRPIHLTVALSGCGHVAESDAEWLRTVIRTWQALPDPATSSRRFRLERDTDITGASGTGVVADGIVWPDGTVSIRWRGERPSVVFWERLDDAEAIHGHGGATRFVWLD